MYPILSRRDARGRTLLHYAVGQLKDSVVGENLFSDMTKCLDETPRSAACWLQIRCLNAYSWRVHKRYEVYAEAHAGVCQGSKSAINTKPSPYRI